MGDYRRGFFVAPYLHGLFWKGTTKSGAWSGLISGVAISIGGSLLFPDKNAAPVISAVAMLVPLGVLPLVSVFTKKYDAAHLERVFSRAGLELTLAAGAKE